MNEFGELRKRIDDLIGEIKLWIKRKSIHESIQRLEIAEKLLVKLKQLAVSEMQNKAVSNRISKLRSLENRIDEVLSKREAGKREDGNIALKCNWNDRLYRAPCSLSAHKFNLL